MINTYYHGGDVGDTIYFGPALRGLGGGNSSSPPRMVWSEKSTHPPKHALLPA